MWGDWNHMASSLQSLLFSLWARTHGLLTTVRIMALTSISPDGLLSGAAGPNTSIWVSPDYSPDSLSSQTTLPLFLSSPSQRLVIPLSASFKPQIRKLAIVLFSLPTRIQLVMKSGHFEFSSVFSIAISLIWPASIFGLNYFKHLLPGLDLIQEIHQTIYLNSPVPWLTSYNDIAIDICLWLSELVSEDIFCWLGSYPLLYGNLWVFPKLHHACSAIPQVEPVVCCVWACEHLFRLPGNQRPPQNC